MPQAALSLLTDFYRAAIAGAQPERVTQAAIGTLGLSSGSRVFIIALGKAARGMAAGALSGLAQARLTPVGGVAVAPTDAALPDAPGSDLMRVVAGDHPVPGAGSLAAANAIGALAAGVGPDADVIVLVSGGGSSLAAAPAPEVSGYTQADVGALYTALLDSGADIHMVNAVRKRFVRWTAGRLAVALAPARVHCLAVSDVPGDDVAAISSGPCSPDPELAPALVARLRKAGIWTGLPTTARAYLEAATDNGPETPKPGNPAFERTTSRVILSNRDALEAAAHRARAAGIDEVTVVPTLLTGEAAIAGVRLASELIARRRRARGPRISRCVLWGGETTVTMSSAPPPPRSAAPLGGRSQELALAASRSFSDAGEQASDLALLAAGTDGRDGPTDAAGAIVDAHTWSAIAAAGRDPAADLARHDAYHALDAVGALLRTGLTETNVMDLVIGLIL